MQPRHALVALLLAAFLAADAATLICGGNIDFPRPAAVAHFALGLSQLSLLAIWMGLGNLHVLLRLPIASGVATVLTVYVHHGSLALWIALVAVLLLVVAVPLGIARWRTGLRLDAGSAEGSPFAERRPVQFSLRNLMLSVTLIGVALGLMRALAPLIQVRGYQPWHEAPIIGGGLAIVGLAATWFGLGTGRWLLKCCTLIAVTGGVGWLFAVVAGPPVHRLPVFLLVAIETVLLAGSLAVLRIAGYRLTRRASGGTIVAELAEDAVPA